ncbi:MAG: Ig-like domain-containing protein [Gemmataceae bacterium]
MPVPPKVRPWRTRRQATPALEPLEGRAVPAGLLTGVGAIGTSYTSERGGNNWTEQLASGRGINFGPASPVSSNGVSFLDYAYVLGGQPQTMVANGAIGAMAARVADGSVTLVFLDGATSDFAPRIPAIYHGTLAGPQLDTFIDAEVALLRTALDTLAASGDVKVVLENVGDFGRTPFVVQNVFNFLGLQPGEVPDPAKLQRFTDAIQVANVRLQNLADERGIPVDDFFAWGSRLTDLGHPPVVGGLPLDVSPTFGKVTSFSVTDPLRLFIDSQHVGPVAQGIKANVCLEAIRQAYGADVAPFSDQEILTYAYGRAGLAPPAFTQTTYFDITSMVRYNHAPTAAGDSALTHAGAPVTVGVLANDGDPDGDPLRVAGVTQGAHGSVTVNANGTLTYTPDAGFKGGTDTFSYTVSDGRYRTATASVTVRVIRTVQIDVKPGGATNDTNLGSEGVVSVALLGEADFDVRQVQAATVTFAGASAYRTALEDVNRDGRLDLVLHFRIQDTNLRQVYAQLLADDKDADGVLDSTRQEATVTLTGQAAGDVLFEGTDRMSLFLSGKALRQLLDELAAAHLL